MDIHDDRGMYIGFVRDNGDVVIGGTYQGHFEPNGDFIDNDGNYRYNIG